MRILIIGGAGYIGSHVTREFLDKGFNVTVFDNLSTGRYENLFPKSPFIKGDILNYKFLLKTLKKGYDAIVHLAAFKAAGESMLYPEKYSINNICGTINILNAMCETNTKFIIFSSSAAVYGNPQYLPINENHPLSPENYYGFTKLEIEYLLSWYSKLKGINYACLRYFNAAGYDGKERIKGLEKNPANLIPIIMEVASGKLKELSLFGNDYNTPDGTCIRDYVHVSDLSLAHVLSLNYIKNKNLILNLGTGTGTSVLEVINTAIKITNKNIPYKILSRRPGDPAILTASNSLAKELLNWEPKESNIENIILSTWKMYKNN